MWLKRAHVLLIRLLLRLYLRMPFNFVNFNGLKIALRPGVFYPKGVWSTSILSKIIPPSNSRVVADVGTGSGVLAVRMAMFYNWVIATDICRRSIAVAKVNAIINKVYDRIDFVVCDALIPFRRVFCFVSLNPPYLPIDPKDRLDEKICGGANLVMFFKIILRSLRSMKRDGVMLVAVSSVSNLDLILLLLRKLKITVQRLYWKIYPFEEIVVLKVKR